MDDERDFRVVELIPCRRHRFLGIVIACGQALDNGLAIGAGGHGSHLLVVAGAVYAYLRPRYAGTGNRVYLLYLD